MILLLAALALAGDPTSVDFDGDGTQDPITLTDDETTLVIGTWKAACGHGGGCDWEVVDLHSGDKQKDLLICASGARNYYCSLATLADGKVLQASVGHRGLDGDKFVVTGSGFVYAKRLSHGTFVRVEKYQWKKPEMVLIPQPFYSADPPGDVKIEKTFKLLFAPKGTTVVGNASPGSTIQVLGEDGEHHGWLMVRLSSGITGWVEARDLADVSAQFEKQSWVP